MRKLAIIVGCVLYVICPIDLVPDFLPIAGQLDDLLVIVNTVRSVLKKTEGQGV